MSGAEREMAWASVEVGPAGGAGEVRVRTWPVVEGEPDDYAWEDADERGVVAVTTIERPAVGQVEIDVLAVGAEQAVAEVKRRVENRG